MGQSIQAKPIKSLLKGRGSASVDNAFGGQPPWEFQILNATLALTAGQLAAAFHYCCRAPTHQHQHLSESRGPTGRFQEQMATLLDETVDTVASPPFCLAAQLPMAILDAATSTTISDLAERSTSNVRKQLHVR